MNTKRILWSAVMMMLLLTSCLNNEDPYTAGFVISSPQQGASGEYANSIADTVVLFSYGDWTMAQLEGNDWAKPSITKGKAGYEYRFPVAFAQNTTGVGRRAGFKVTDSDHPDKANASFYYYQYATRGDGTLGNAPDVKTITGSDQSRFEMTYDEQHRPLSLRMTKDNQLLRSLTLTYGDDYTIRLKDGEKQYQAEAGRDFQPYTLCSETDTISYFSVYTDYGYLPSNRVFNIEHHRNGVVKACTFFPMANSLAPDSLHNADSLYYYADGKTRETIYCKFGNQDNRCQTVDVNQLVMGVDELSPYLLLSLFRDARNTSILSEVKSVGRNLKVVPTLNVDKSVSKLEVTDADKGTTITYTFEY